MRTPIRQRIKLAGNKKAGMEATQKAKGKRQKAKDGVENTARGLPLKIRRSVLIKLTDVSLTRIMTGGSLFISRYQAVRRSFAFCLLPFALSFAFCFLPCASAQSGRPIPPRDPSAQEPGKRPAPSATDSRPRRAIEEGQDEGAIKLSASLVTVITSVTDMTGNQVNDLKQSDFELYEDDSEQDIAGFYREGQLPLRLIFLFDTSSSIRHRFEFEQRAAAQFFRQVLRPGDQAAIMSVSSDPRLELQFTSNIDRLVNTLAGLKVEGATALYNALVEAAHYIRPAEGRHVIVGLSDGTDTASASTLA